MVSINIMYLRSIYVAELPVGVQTSPKYIPRINGWEEVIQS